MSQAGTFEFRVMLPDERSDYPWVYGRCIRTYSACGHRVNMPIRFAGRPDAMFLPTELPCEVCEKEGKK